MPGFDGTVVVIGASGFLGVAICREWLRSARDAGVEAPSVVCLVRSADCGPGLALLQSHLTMVVRPAITAAVLEEVRQSVGTIAGIFHVAGLVKHSTNAADVAQMHAANVALSDTIFEFAERHNIRTIYASSSGAVGCQFLEDRHRVAHDDDELCTATVAPFPYYVQKVDVERRWRDRALKGRVPVVFMRPSLLLGPGDDRLSSTRVVLDYVRGRLPFLPAGGVSFVDVRDVAAAFVLAMVCDDTVAPGTAMNLTAANVPFSQFAGMLEEVTGIPAPRFEVPAAVARVGGQLITTVNSALGRPRDEGKDPVFVEMGNRFWNVSCQRALQLVEFDPRDPLTTLKDTARYLHATFGRDSPVTTPMPAPPSASPSSRRLSPPASRPWHVSLRLRRWRWIIAALLACVIIFSFAHPF